MNPNLPKSLSVNQVSELGSLLATMGNTVHKVAATLQDAGIRGVRNTARFLNPIVRYCQRHLMVDGVALDVMERGLLRVQVRGITDNFPLPPPIIEFLDCFNRGAWPDLELGQE